MQTKNITREMFVRHIPKNELGLVKEAMFLGARCWYHLGGTTANTPYELIEPLNFNVMLNMTFSNEYAKASLIERYLRMKSGGDVSDLIDERDIRPMVRDMLSEKTINAVNKISEIVKEQGDL